MTRDRDLTALDAHFAFGANWRSFAGAADEAALGEAVAGLSRLLETEQFANKRVLDIGCGSGIHSIAASVLGATHVLGVDIDPACVETAQDLSRRLYSSGALRFEVASVFELDPSKLGIFDVVYSWGVLHHTGNLDHAIRRAASMVAPGGLLALALYRRTLCCPLWSVEKRWYTSASPAARRLADAVYTRCVQLALWTTFRRLSTYKANYKRDRRGMDFIHDVRDWLGGYPYESISAQDLDRRLRELGFSAERCWVKSDLVSRVGILGSGCDEYLYRRV